MNSSGVELVGVPSLWGLWGTEQQKEARDQREPDCSAKIDAIQVVIAMSNSRGNEENLVLRVHAGESPLEGYHKSSIE